MKQILITTIAAVLLVGCGESQQSAPTSAEVKPAEPVAKVPSQPSPPPAESKPAEPVAEASQPEPPAAEAPDISIHKAAGKGNIEAVKQHLAAGTDVNAKNKHGYTPLHAAAEEGHKEVAELLIQNGANVNAKNVGSTPLHEAAKKDHKEIAELLIEKGADVNAKGDGGRTPLHNAANKEIAELLIAKGADVDGWSWEKVQSQRCVNKLKQIGIATRIYATDNQDRYPWQVPQSEGGTAEIAQPRSDTDALLDSDGKPIFDANAWRHFQALSNELSNPKVLRCPNDESRTQANTFQSTPPKGAGRNVIPFDKNSVSYWLRTDPEVGEARRNEVMVVCPHHDGQYNILLTDSSVQQASWNRLAQYFKDITNPITIAPQ